MIEDRARLFNFVSHIRTNDAGCWIWDSARPGGYGIFNPGKEAPTASIGAHRWAYEYFVGPIPEGLYLDHICETRACCNPTHVVPATQGENVRRAFGFEDNKHCTNGHEYDFQNTYFDPKGWRRCRTCRRLGMKNLVLARKLGQSTLINKF